ncbi:MAG TPA: flavodoxin family protein [Candidatus Deferrimicrobiaceae bacterium]
MRKLLGIVASPRKLGNCELLVKAIAERVPGPPELRILRLTEKEIRPCKGCYRCLAGECPLKDDYGLVLAAILDADALVVAAPTYLRGPNSAIQRFLDRGLQFWKHIEALDGKPAVAVATAGVAGGEGHALLGVENFLRGMGMDIRGRAVVHAALPGEALLSEEAKASVAALSAALSAPDPDPPEGPVCTACGGRYFEFRGGCRVYCLLCGATGDVAPRDGGISLRTVPPAHNWQGREAMRSHGEWLREMRERYLRERERLKEVSRRYAGGDFI